jgi:hypothetical protein
MFKSVGSTVKQLDHTNNNNNAQSVSTARRPAGSRFAAVVALLPIGLLVFAGISAQAKRTIQAQVDVLRFGTSDADAAKIAAEVCSQVLGTAAKPVAVTTQSAYSVRRNVNIREWNVVCTTPDGQYLLRINAETKHVYAINRIGNVNTDPINGMDNSSSKEIPEPAPEILAGDAHTRLSRDEAEVNARRYLQMLGVSDRAIEPVQDQKSYDGVRGPLWNFTFRNATPGVGRRLVKVSVNGDSGDLEHVWNPVQLR